MCLARKAPAIIGTIVRSVRLFDIERGILGRFFLPGACVLEVHQSYMQRPSGRCQHFSEKVIDSFRPERVV